MNTDKVSKYANGKVYTIRSPHTDKLYVGSTCSPLYKRWYAHKSDWTNGTRSREIISAGDAYIELYELYPCTCKEELEKREHEVIRSYGKLAVNKYNGIKMPERTKEEKYKISHEVMQCKDCGKEYKRYYKSCHEFSRYHKDYLAKKRLQK